MKKINSKFTFPKLKPVHTYQKNDGAKKLPETDPTVVTITTVTHIWPF
jgi:hypothetical protein